MERRRSRDLRFMRGASFQQARRSQMRDAVASLGITASPLLSRMSASPRMMIPSTIGIIAMTFTLALAADQPRADPLAVIRSEEHVAQPPNAAWWNFVTTH